MSTHGPSPTMGQQTQASKPPAAPGRREPRYLGLGSTKQAALGGSAGVGVPAPLHISHWLLVQWSQLDHVRCGEKGKSGGAPTVWNHPQPGQGIQMGAGLTLHFKPGPDLSELDVVLVQLLVHMMPKRGREGRLKI